MTNPIFEIDHLLCYVENLQQAASTYKNLGFTVAPISKMDQMGLANHLVLFPSQTEGTANFIELMGTTGTQTPPPAMTTLLQGSSGIRSMVLSGPDVYAAQDRIVKAGFEKTIIADIERDWVLPNGDVLSPSFSVMMPQIAPFIFNYCQYRNIAPYTNKDWLEHENGALAFSSVFCISNSPKDVLERYEKMFSSSLIQENKGTYTLGPGHVKMHVGTLKQMAEILPPSCLEHPVDENAYLGFSIQVGNIEHTRELFERRNIAFEQQNGCLYLSPETAYGNVIEFTL